MIGLGMMMAATGACCSFTFNLSAIVSGFVCDCVSGSGSDSVSAPNELFLGLYEGTRTGLDCF